jgi:hypothetical protein
VPDRQKLLRVLKDTDSKECQTDRQIHKSSHQTDRLLEKQTDKQIQTPVRQTDRLPRELHRQTLTRVLKERQTQKSARQTDRFTSVLNRKTDKQEC